MKISMALLTVILFLSCNSTITPKETVINFATSLKKLEFEKAESLLTNETKPVFQSFKVEYQNAASFQNELAKSRTIQQSEIVAELRLDSSIETTVGINAIVQSKDSTNQIRLENQNGSWKIVCNKDLLDGILFAQKKRQTLEESYRTLQEQYQRKVDIIMQLLVSRDTKGKNEETINQKLKEINRIGVDVSNSFLFGKKYNELDNLLTNYFELNNVPPNLAVQLEGIENRIHIYTKQFNESVSKYNKGFGQKVQYIPANAIVKDIKVKF